MLADKGVFESLKLSFIGCLRNIVPFLVYGIVLLILIVIALIPAGITTIVSPVFTVILGILTLLIIFPALLGSVYAAYKDIYGA